MLECLSFNSSTSSSASTAAVPNRPPSSQEGTSTSNVSHEFNITVQANSYTEIRSKIQAPPIQGQVHLLLLPDPQHVHDTLAKTENNNLISTYFHHTETASELCLHLHDCLHRARAMYAPLHDLLAIIEFDCIYISQPHCHHAFDLFCEFDSQDNPFLDSQKNNFTNIRTCLSDLKKQLDACLKRSRSRIRLFRRASACSAVCFVATAVGVAVSAVVVTVHAIVAFAACGAVPVCSVYNSCKKRELARLKQLDAAAKGAYVLSNDLDTIDRLVARLHTAVEGDKLLVRLGLERGRDSYPIQEVLKQLCKNHQNFLHQLEDLEEHISLCLYTVNKARSLLFQEICNHQTS
ncbi:hypothetical protein RIF29_19931 [Crotalaria pallida]|uniref:Uncharacterized protein n=1 Tax=Crotalaria pallida TaxID=3830 RepID=A0AAN9I6Z7_CROPI